VICFFGPITNQADARTKLKSKIMENTTHLKFTPPTHRPDDEARTDEGRVARSGRITTQCKVRTEEEREWQHAEE